MRRLLLVLAAVLATSTASCSQPGAAADDAYRIGCPAVDAALGGSTMASSVAVKGLEALRDSGQLGDEARTWVDAAITTLGSADPTDVPGEAKNVIVQGCAKHGHPLQNLR